MKVLLLEDNSTDADLTKRGLVSHVTDCEVDIAPTLKIAREMLLQEEKYDIAILDMYLPDGNGLELLLEIREKEMELATIILTGSGDEEVATAALKAGANDYIVKKQGYTSKLARTVSFAIDNFKQSLSRNTETINVLYIEHNAFDIDLTIRHLKQYSPNIHVDAVVTAQEAIERLKNSKKEFVHYQVIMLDYSLPGVNSFELIKSIRQELQLYQPIILVTGMGNEEIAVQALKLGAYDYLNKNRKYFYRLPNIIKSAWQYSELERKQAALVESEAKYRLLAENSGDVISILDLDFNYTYISPAIKSLRGHEPKEMMNQNISEVLTPASFKKAKSVFTRLIGPEDGVVKSPDQSVLIELELIKKDKATVWTEVKASLIRDENNKPVGILGVSRDISKRKFAIEELRKLSRAIEQSPASVMITDVFGKIEYVNPKFTQITGYSMSDVLGKNPNILKSGYTNQKEYENLWNRITSGEEWRGELLNKRKDGSRFWELVSISAIKNSEGEITHFLAVKEDVTDRKKMMDDLIIAKEKAEESDRLKSAFLTNMSHEIRTPMNGILGFINLLNEPNLSENKKAKYSEIINKSGQRMLNTISDIIEMSNIDAGLIDVKMSLVNLNDLLTDQHQFFLLDASNKGLILKLSLPDKDILIESDLPKLESVLSNLINNAIKFTESGEIDVGLQLNDKVVIFVKDTGKGIDANKTDTIFERFNQAETVDNRGYEGNGLGLAIAKAYVEKLDGRIWVESGQGVGSTFFVQFHLNAAL